MTIALIAPYTTQAVKPQEVKLCAMAGAIASFVAASIPECIGGTSMKYYIGSAAVQNMALAPKPDGTIIDTRLKKLLSSLSRFPNRTFPYFEKAKKRPTINVSSNNT